MNSRAFEFSIRNSDIYSGVGGYARTQADLVMFQQFVTKDRYIAYVPYGPEIEPSEENQGRFLEELSECLRSYLAPGCIAIRYDLNWMSHWCKDEDFDSQGNWRGLPKKEFQEINLNFGTAEHSLRKSNMNVLPSDTIVVDLTRSEEEILASMKPKTRYNIRLSLRKDIEVRAGGAEVLPIWYALYLETARRNGLHVNEIRYFRSVFASGAPGDEDEVGVRLLTAWHRGEPLAVMFLVRSEHRATYLYGAFGSKRRNLMPTYALQWEAIRRAKAAGCLEYDMFGVAPQTDPTHPMYGLWKFKYGFGGEIFHQLGCWDYPLLEEDYQGWSAYGTALKGYYA